MVCFHVSLTQGRQSIVQLRLGGKDVVGTGFNIRVADDESGKLVVAEVLSSASDALRLLMNAGLYFSSLLLLLLPLLLSFNSRFSRST